jgi:(E)-4-hydroxy-3-methylbut-2-enyl-diphosphate synthase
VRCTANNEQSAKAFSKIKDRVDIPLVADIHFDYKLAILAIESGADKIRINPGNIGKKERVKKVVDCAKTHGIPIRVGVNSGSLEKDLLKEFGSTSDAMVKSALGHVNMLENMGFYDIVVSLKGSDVVKTVKACRVFDEVSDYPQHLGITEAGTLEQGLIKSGAGIGSLLLDGIGDTIRISLSGDPVREVRAAWDLLNACGLRKRGVEIISCPTCGRTCIDVENLAQLVKDEFADIPQYIKVAVMGCVVNGPGEAREADIGIAGGNEYLFEDGDIIAKIKNEDALNALKARILKKVDKG